MADCEETIQRPEGPASLRGQVGDAMNHCQQFTIFLRVFKVELREAGSNQGGQGGNCEIGNGFHYGQNGQLGTGGKVNLKILIKYFYQTKHYYLF